MSNEKKIRCPECNEEISCPTSVCPECGARIRTYGALVYLETGDIVVLGTGNQIIGRTMLSFVESKKISRSHVMIHAGDDNYFIEDMGSTNGTKVNNQPLEKGEKLALHNGDIVSLAGELFSFLIMVKSDRPDGQENTEETVLI